MDLLSEITRAIDFLKAKPDEVDVSDVISILSTAHAVAKDGLDRSHQAESFRVLKPRFEELRNSFNALGETANKDAADLQAALRELDTFKGLFAELRKEVSGQLDLIARYGDTRKRDLKKEIEEADVERFVRLRRAVREDFINEWKDADRPEILAGSGTFVNFRNYKTGA